MSIRDWKVATRCACLDLARTLRRWLRATSGNVMIEAGFLIPLLIVLAMGGYDFGRLALHKITVTNAARAGTQYGTQDLITAADTDGMIQAARNDAGDAEGLLTVNARQYCACTNEGEVACTASCADGSFSMLYVEVTVQDEVELLYPYPGIGSPKSVETTARMRVR